MDRNFYSRNDGMKWWELLLLFTIIFFILRFLFRMIGQFIRWLFNLGTNPSYSTPIPKGINTVSMSTVEKASREHTVLEISSSKNKSENFVYKLELENNHTGKTYSKSFHQNSTIGKQINSQEIKEGDENVII